MDKNIQKKQQKSSSFADNEAKLPFVEHNIEQKTQKDNFPEDNGSAIDKKLVKGILKEEKRQIRESKRLEKAQNKENIKQKNKKIREIIKNKKIEERQIRKANEQTLKELEKRGKFASWFRLDNAGSIYPSAIKSDWNFVVRVSAVLYDEVVPEELQGALDDILPRFPTFNVRLCHGFFWNYYERNFSRLLIEKETKFPCTSFNLNNPEDFLIRVLYSSHKIIFEFFHAITDGRGGLFFLNSLLARYFERLGTKIENYEGCANYLDIPQDAEIADSFQDVYTKEKLKRQKERPAYKIKGNVLPSGMVNTIEGEIAVDSLKQTAKKYDATVTEFLTAVVGYVIYKKRKNTKRPTRISVPIDLRPRFSSKTVRNFSSYVNIEIEGDSLTFEKTVEIVKNALKKVDNNTLQANINANVAIQRNFFVKILPLFLKNIIMKNCFNFMGENFQTLSLSNIGLVKVPKEFDDKIDSYCFNLGRSLHNAKSIGIISFKNKLNFCISSKLYETETERDIFTFLSSLGLDIKIYSNRRDLYASR